MRTIRWGMIGCGDVTERKSGPGFAKARHSELRAVMRRNGELAADYARRHGVAPVLPVELPRGTTLQRRQRGEREYFFAHHFGQDRVALSLGGLGLREFWSGESVERLELGSFESAVLVR